jgi:hypothetical protein
MPIGSCLATISARRGGPLEGPLSTSEPRSTTDGLGPALPVTRVSDFVRSVPFGPVGRVRSSWFGRVNPPRRRLRSRRARGARRALHWPAVPSPSSAKRRARHFDTKPANDETMRAYPSGCAKHPVPVFEAAFRVGRAFRTRRPEKLSPPSGCLARLALGPVGGAPLGEPGRASSRLAGRSEIRRFGRGDAMPRAASAVKVSLAGPRPRDPRAFTSPSTNRDSAP